MKPANDPTTDYKALVEQGYNNCAAAYDKVRKENAEQTVIMLIERLDDGAVVLDVGCGPGVPVTQALAQRFTVTGIDISEKMVARARKNVPEGTFLHSDIMSVDFPPAHFDAVVAFYSIFHLPREEHETLFRRIHRWLRPGGFIMATVGLWNESGYTEDEFFGVTMYWSNYSEEAYKHMLEKLGFDLLDVTTVGHGYEEKYQAPEERHPLVFAQKHKTAT